MFVVQIRVPSVQYKACDSMRPAETLPVILAKIG